MPGAVCKVIICGVGRALAVSRDAELLLNYSNLTEPTHVVAESVRDVADNFARQFGWLEKRPDLFTPEMEAMFFHFEKAARSTLVAALDAEAAE